MALPRIAKLCIYHAAPGDMLAKVQGALRGSIQAQMVLIGVSTASYRVRIEAHADAPAVNDLIEIRAEIGEYRAGQGAFTAFTDSRLAGVGNTRPASAGNRQYWYQPNVDRWYSYRREGLNIWVADNRPTWLNPWRGRYATRQAALDGVAGNGNVYIQADNAILTISNHVPSDMPDSDTLFAGTVERVKIKMDRDAGQRASAVCTVTVRDYAGIAGHVLVVKRYEMRTLKQIITDIVDSYLTGFGISVASDAPDGPTIEVASWSYVPAARAIEEVVRLAGYLWRIDAGKVLHFFTFAGQPAGFEVNENSRLWETIEVEEDLSDYRSTQYLRGGYATIARRESYRGDGTSRTWPLALPIANGRDDPPTVTYSGSTENAVILGEAAGNWEWRPGGQSITRAAAAAAIPDRATIRVDYVGAYPILVQAIRNPTAGVRERLVLDETIGALDAARQRANALLDNFAGPAEDLKLRTREAGISVGHSLAIEEPLIGASGQYVVQQVTIRDDGHTGAIYSVQAVKRSAARWREYWTSEREALEGLSLRADEVLQEFVDQDDALDIWAGDSVVFEDASQAGRVGTATVDANIVGSE